MNSSGSTSPSKIEEFWAGRAQERVSPGEVTHRDIWQRWLEIELVKQYVRKSDRVLDVGCGNGHTTRILSRRCASILGVDYSAGMIERARIESRSRSFRNASYAVLDVRELDPGRFGTFDVVLTERCLINLGSFAEQRKAIANIASVLRPGGRFVFVEGSADGRANLNRLRKSVGLPAMPRVWHNLDFDEAETLRFLKRRFTIEERRHFGTYDYLSRVVHPLLVKPRQPRYDAEINRIAAKLALVCSEHGEISRVLFLVLKKR